MTPLATRKRLLIAESDLNRARLMMELDGLTNGFRALSGRSSNVQLVASSSVGFAAGLAAFQRGSAIASGGGRPSRLQTVLQCAGFAASLWLAFRAPRSKPAPR